MKKILFALTLMQTMFLVGCSGGTTLKELAEMSELERQELTEIKLIVDLPENSELDFWKTFEGCINLRKVEIDKNFKGTIMGYADRNSPEHIESIIAEGATHIGYSCFYAGANEVCNRDIIEIKMPSVVNLNPHAFGGSRNSNKIRELDFPKLMGLGDELAGCKMLTTLKLGNDGPIVISTSFYGSLNTENIDLYLGKYEYENHVEGNLFYPHLYPDRTTGDYSFGDPDISKAIPSGKPIKFKSIQQYKQ